MAKMWVMFLTSLMLVSTMNLYAVIREPDLIDIDELPNFTRETVKIEGTLTSYVRDPYDSGDDRIDLQVQNGWKVVKVRWYETGHTEKIPSIGSMVIVEGEVVEWNGRLWLQASGLGAVYVKLGEVNTPIGVSLTELSLNASDYDGVSVTVEGFIGDVLQPDLTRQTLSIMDNPSYSNADHILSMRVEGRVDGWYESGSQVIVRGWLQFDERSYRWQLFVQGGQITVLHEAGSKSLSWAADTKTWTYDIGKHVTILGTGFADGNGWAIQGPTETDKICMLADSNSTAGDIEGVSKAWSGRLVWDDLAQSICLDAGHDPLLVNPVATSGSDATPLGSVSLDPFRYVNGTFEFEGYITDPISPDYNKGYLADGPDYFSRSTKIRLVLIGERSEWIEAGQKVRVNATVIWDTADSRVFIEARSMNLTGPTPAPVALEWGGGFDAWRWEVGKRVNIHGIINESEDGSLWIERSGSSERLCLLGDGTEASQLMGTNETMEWIGRLVTTNDLKDNVAMFCLDLR